MKDKFIYKDKMNSLNLLINIHWKFEDRELEEVTIDEITTRELNENERNEYRRVSTDEIRNILRNIRANFDLPRNNPNVVTFIYYSYKNLPELVTYRASDLPNALAVLGAIDTFYSQDVGERATQEERNNIEELVGGTTLYDAIKADDPESTFYFIGLKYLWKGVYIVDFDSS